MQHRLKMIGWFSNLDQVVLGSGLALVAATWLFIAVAYGVSAGRTQQLDEWLLRTLRVPDAPEVARGPAWLGEVLRDLTACGSLTVLGLTTAAVAGYLLMAHKYRALTLLLAATLGGALLSMLLKDLFDRPRPGVVPHLTRVNTASFPSGHSMLSAVVYLTLGSLLARLVERRQLKIYFLGVPLALSLLVGVSRIYMGVHYPTDVLAGWSAGLAWALLCSLVARQLQQRGAVEKSAT